MKILQFMASEKWGGAEKVFVEISNGLAQRHCVYALVLRDTEYLERFSKRVNIIILQSHPTRHNPFQLLEIRRIIKEVGPDCIHTHADKASELVRSATLFLPVRHVATKHNARKGRIFNRLPYVTAVSQTVQNSVRKKHPGGFVRVVPNGIEIHSPQVLQKNDVFSIAAIGRLDKVKGFDVLIRQLEKVASPCILNIVGEGGEHEDLKKEIEQKRLQKRIFLQGFCEDIPSLMNNADLVVISSSNEGFSLVCIEALQYANVLLSTPVGIAAEILPPPFLCEQSFLGERISDIINNYSSYSADFKKVKEAQAHKYFLANVILQYEEVYKEMTSRES